MNIIIKRGSSKVWRRLTDDQLEHLMLATIDNRRQTRTPAHAPERSAGAGVETPDFRKYPLGRSRYGLGGESRPMEVRCMRSTIRYFAAKTYSTNAPDIWRQTLSYT